MNRLILSPFLIPFSRFAFPPHHSLAKHPPQEEPPAAVQP
jgi:hypothetical protein